MDFDQVTVNGVNSNGIITLCRENYNFTVKRFHGIIISIEMVTL